MNTLADIAALNRMLARVKRRQQRHFARTGRLLTPHDNAAWALRQTIDDLQRQS